MHHYPNSATGQVTSNVTSYSGSLAQSEQDVSSTESRDPIILRHFEYAAAKAVVEMGDRAFPAEVARVLTNSLGRNVSLAQAFIALERLEKRKLMSSRFEIPGGPNGRRRRVFKMEKIGLQALQETAAAFSQPIVSATTEVDDVTGFATA